MHPYTAFVEKVTAVRADGRELPLGGLPPCARVTLADDAPRALILSPHPDDECIIGGLPLRLLREGGWRVVNVAVTQGSNRDRQAARLEEVRAACGFLQFDLVTTAPGGLEGINPATRDRDHGHWAGCVNVIARLLAEQRPRAIFFPHELDWNSTHIGVHFLVMDALRALPVEFEAWTIETEFWGQMPTPNLMVESSAADVADLIAGTSFHVGEVRRNPYHLIQPAWMQDNVRRGGELVGGQGKGPPDFIFATLYRLRRWARGELVPAWVGGRHLAAGEDLKGLFV
ncbi:MAG: PIG-L deacetylase family protein [Limisphaerales bacterium]